MAGADTSLIELSLARARAGLLDKAFSARELAQAHIAAMQAGGALNAFVLETADKALTMADMADKNIAKGVARPLEGIPLGVKDLFCTKGVRSTACSKILGDFIPPYESTVTQNLWDAGAVLLGKLNMDEFAMGSSNETSCFGAVVNPWRGKDDVALVPGGSSGGAAASVAAHIGVAAIASDTGGSIRQPASLTGTVGLKPSYGLCSRYGMIAFASSLDQAGPITRNVMDAALLLDVMASDDRRDSTSCARPQGIPPYAESLDAARLATHMKGKRVGIPREYRLESLSPEITALWQQGADWLEAAGAEIVDISLPHTKYALPAYYIIAPAEASSNLARYDGMRYGLRTIGEDIDDTYERTRAEGFGDEVKRRVMIGTYALSAGYYDAYYLKARQVRRLISEDFRNAATDFILTPTAPSSAFAIGAEQDPITMYMNDVFTVPTNLAGLPAISVPAGCDAQGLPLGLQIIGQRFDETGILQTASLIEEAAGFTARPNPWWRK